MTSVGTARAAATISSPAGTLIGNHRVFVIVRAYNEAAVLGSTLHLLMPFGYSIVVVDDGSQDGTKSIAKQFSVHYVQHAVNLGPGAALQTGITYAVQNGADVIITFDADGQHPASQIPTLIAPILADECDVVIGSRFLNPDDLALVPRAKRFVLRVGRIVSGVLAGVWLTDTHNGFRAFSRKAAEKIRVQETGFAYATELLDQIRRNRLRLEELPATIRYSEYSRQKGQKLSNSMNIVLDLLLRKVLR